MVSSCLLFCNQAILQIGCYRLFAFTDYEQILVNHDEILYVFECVYISTFPLHVLYET